MTLLFVTELLEYSNDAHEAYYTQLVLERNDIQDKNAKLEEYQEKVKNVNERVNYQKIELARVVNDLEQANRKSSPRRKSCVIWRLRLISTRISM